MGTCESGGQGCGELGGRSKCEAKEADSPIRLIQRSLAGRTLTTARDLSLSTSSHISLFGLFIFTGYKEMNFLAHPHSLG